MNTLCASNGVAVMHCGSPSRFAPIGVDIVYFYLDFKNIWRGAVNFANRQAVSGCCKVRIDAANLKRLVRGQRQWGLGYGALALPEPANALKTRFLEHQIQLDVFESGRNSGREQGVDQIIQGEIRKLLSQRTPRGVVALATGDGNGHQFGQVFLPVLDDLHEAGFTIEVYSWRESLNRALRKWAERDGKLVELDDWFHEITFLQRRRAA